MQERNICSGYVQNSDGSEAWYYMRITEQDQGHANEMLSLAEDFSSKLISIVMPRV